MFSIEIPVLDKNHPECYNRIESFTDSLSWQKEEGTMTEFVRHPEFGDICYTEGFWSGKKTLMINGKSTIPIGKKRFLHDGKTVVLKGNSFAGVSIVIDGQTVRVSPAPKWYEIILALLPFLFLVTWGNSPALCSIFPVVGGAIGGALGGVGLVVSRMAMKSQRNPLTKIFLGLGVFALTVFAAFILAVLIVAALTV